MNKQAIGAVLLAVGAVLLWWGYDVGQSVRGQWTRAWSGGLPDKAMLLYVLGAAAVAFGLFQLLRRK